MNRAADVRSVESIREFRADLVAYQGKLRQAIELLGVELSRGEGWFDRQQTYWPAETRRASDELAETRAALGRCMLGKGKDRESACDDERALMIQAKRRLSFCEQQIRVTKNWCLEIAQGADTFRNGLARAIAITEGDLPKAIAALDQITESLDRYTEQSNSTSTVLGQLARDATAPTESPRNDLTSGIHSDETPKAVDDTHHKR